MFEDVTLHIGQSEHMALVGRNGSGKSTLMKVITGQIEADDGERYEEPGLRISYLPQEPSFEGFATVGDYVSGGLGRDKQHEYFRAEAMLAETGLPPERSTEGLSGGEARRAALARAFVDDPDILLMDEPTNHLDLAAIEWLEGRLQRFRGALLVVSHDRRFLDNVSKTTLWLDRGVLHRLDKSFSHFEEWAEKLLADEAAARARLDKEIASETQWAREGISARRKRNMGRMRRLDELRQARAQQIKQARGGKINAENTDPTGRIVIKAINVAKAYGERTIIQDFSTQIMRGDRIGVIGPNGAGKTTLVKLLMGELKPDRGKVRLGANIDAITVEQDRSTLNPSRTVKQTLCGEIGDHVTVGGRTRHVLGYLKDFLFEVRQAEQPVGALSGGERNRLLLARELARPSNLMVLDEPTNDLDMDTLDMLEDMLASYEGTIIVVSHDRDFLDRVATSTIVLEGNGTAEEYPGGYSTYEMQRKKPEAEDTPEKPARPKQSHQPTARPKPTKPATKLSYKDQRALEILPTQIAEAETEIKKLEALLADPELFSRDPRAFTAATAKLEQTQAEKARMEDEWLEVEMKREELESG